MTPSEPTPRLVPPSRPTGKEEPALVSGVGGPPRGVTEAQRGTLAALGDLLIPAGDDMPSASTAGVARQGLDALLQSRPDLLEGLTRALDAVATLPASAALDRLRTAQDQTPFEVLTTTVVGAYFLIPDIRLRLGYPGQRALPPVDPSLDPEDEELVREVVARGTIFRE